MTRKILVIDDEASTAYSVKAVLEDRHDVATATSALRAFKYLSAHKVDLILLDIKMPQINGIEALGEIKKRHPEIIVIMLSAYASADNKEKSMSLGAKGFVIKPFDVNELRDIVDRAIRGQAIT